MQTVDHIAGQTFHGRKGEISNAFRYSIDYVLCDAEAALKTPWFFGRNRRGLAALYDTDHGGPPKGGRGASWVREVLAEHDIGGITRIDLLAQPRMLGHVFNPVSFWLCSDTADGLRAVIAEVSNTYGDRHCYLCAHPDQRPIQPKDQLCATKIFYVSPFQVVEGSYTFRFDVSDQQVNIVIDYTAGNGGLIATLKGNRAPLSNLSILRALVRRPLGSRRVLALIHWQALKLWWKGATFRTRPKPPTNQVTR